MDNLLLVIKTYINSNTLIIFTQKHFYIFCGKVESGSVESYPHLSRKFVLF